MIAAHSGLGYMIHVNQDLLRTDRVIGGMIAIGVVGLAMDFLMRRLDRYLSPWLVQHHE
jgi:ABC-type nitrate/sulfonate/bicarbonate transport system permease component